MIRLTRLNNKPLAVNSDLIKFIENAPDTVLTLISGEKIVVLESCEEIISRVVEFRRQLAGPQPFPTVEPEVLSRPATETQDGVRTEKPEESQ